MMNQVSDAIEWATGELRTAGVENARFEAQLLLALALGVSRASVVAQTVALPTDAQWQAFAELVARRKERVPLAYLRGTQEFYGLEFAVSSDVLIPRPETEKLVELALEYAAYLLQTQELVTMADVGTGSGCIPIAVLRHQARARAMTGDISPAALALARRNAQQHEVGDRLRFVGADLLSFCRDGSLDMVVSNPPYIASEQVTDLQPEVARYEPRLALDGGTDGLCAYRLLVRQARRALKPHGRLWVEIGQGQADDVGRLLESAGYVNVQTYPDLAGIERIVGGQRPQ